MASHWRSLVAATGLVILCLGWTGSAPAEEEDDWDGLPAGQGREEVWAFCSGCHSLMLVTQQGLSRESWEETLVWMVEEQGMVELDSDTETLVLDYLAQHYGIAQ